MSLKRSKERRLIKIRCYPKEDPGVNKSLTDNYFPFEKVSSSKNSVKRLYPSPIENKQDWKKKGPTIECLTGK